MGGLQVFVCGSIYGEGGVFGPFGATSEEKNDQFLGGNIENYRTKFCPQKDLAPLLGSEFNIDCDFAIKHDPIQSDD